MDEGQKQVLDAAEPRVVRARPLNLRLRDEATAWEAGEPIVGMLIEAAEAIELLAGKVAIQEAYRG